VCLKRNINCLHFARTSAHHRLFWCAHLFIFFSPVMFLYVLRSVLWCPLRFPHINDVCFFFASSCLYEGSCLIYVICVCFHILCCVFALYVFVVCILCYQFLWIAHFRLPLSLAFVYLINRYAFLQLMKCTSRTRVQYCNPSSKIVKETKSRELISAFFLTPK
jgi:hypothetical protein